jgi:putative flippase GtrA
LISLDHVNVPKGQLVRYLLVGAWNTFFGYAVFAVFVYILSDLMMYGYMLASVISNIFAITVAYICYKFLVFKTTGNYMREYLRFYTVYGMAAGLNLALLPVFVAILNLTGIKDIYSPYLAGALLTLVTALFSFFGHRNFSFKPQKIDGGS